MASDFEIDQIIKEFEKEEESDDEDDEPEQHLGFHLTAALDYEFKTAFNIISDGKDSIPKSRVYDLFQMLGYTFQDEDIEEMLKYCLRDLAGQYNLETLTEVYDTFRKNQIPVEDLRILFEDIEVKKKIPTKFPDEQPLKITNSDPMMKEVVTPAKVWNPEIFLPLLKDILPSDAHAMLALDDALGLADEISSQADRKITFPDLVKIFNSS